MFARIERNITNVVAPLTGLMAPLVTAYLTYKAAVVHLGLPLVFGVVAGASVEFLGFSATSTAMTLYSYNRTRRKNEPSAPLGIALALMGIYLAVVTGLTFLVDTMPELAKFAPLVFPFVGVVAAALVAVRVDHQKRLDDIEAERAERKAERAERRATGQSVARSVGHSARSVNGQINGQESGQGVGQMNINVNGDGVNLGDLTQANRARKASKEDAVNAMLAFLTEHPDASFSEAGRAAGRSKSWAVGELGNLETSGRVHRNGNGWEVTG